MARLPTSITHSMLPTRAPTPTRPWMHADARLGPVEQVDGDDDDEHRERAADRGLQHHEPDDDRHAPVGADGGEALADLGGQPSPLGVTSMRS